MKYYALVLHILAVTAFAVPAVAGDAKPDISKMPELFSPAAQKRQREASKPEPVNAVSANTISYGDTIVVARYNGNYKQYTTDLTFPKSTVGTYEYSFEPLEILKGARADTINVRIIEDKSAKDSRSNFTKGGKYLLLLKRIDARDLQQPAGYPAIWYALVSPEAAIDLDEK